MNEKHLAYNIEDALIAMLDHAEAIIREAQTEAHHQFALIQAYGIASAILGLYLDKSVEDRANVLRGRVAREWKTKGSSAYRSALSRLPWLYQGDLVLFDDNDEE